MTAPPDDGGWGPRSVGGHDQDRRRRYALIVAFVSGIAFLALAGTAVAVLQVADSNLQRVNLPSLNVGVEGEPLNVLIVGSDSREGLSEEDRVRYTVGLEETGGQRSDTVILVSVTSDREAINVVSFPRDLPVVWKDRRYKLTETFAGGPDALIDVIHDNFGIDVNHYVEVSITGFVEVVQSLGGVEICLDSRLVDPKSGANFDPGCHEMDPRQALSYVRSRAGARGDFDRMDRQQQFLKALLRRAVDTRTLVDLPKLFAMIEDVASNVRTDDTLGLGEMRSLAERLRGLATGEIPMTIVPGYVRNIAGKSYVLPYGPGARALFDDIDAGEVLASRGPEASRQKVKAAVWSAGYGSGQGIVVSTLQWAGFNAYGAGRGPIEPGPTTTVYVVPGHEEAAGWVAATLGAPTQPLPEDVDAPSGANVVVVTGEDATS